MQADDAHTMVDVIRVTVLARYVLELAFDDGSVKVIDIEDRLTGPDFAWLLDDYDAFRAVCVDPDSGTIRFPNGAELSAAGLWAAARPAVPA